MIGNHFFIFAGPSGCGKTTLLKCIVGKHKVDSGSVDVFGEPPGPKAKTGVPGRRVGYMPQELALFDEFSISETLIYFARLYGKPSVEISECFCYSDFRDSRKPKITLFAILEALKFDFD